MTEFIEFTRGFWMTIGFSAVIMLASVFLGAFARFMWLGIKFGWKFLD